MFDWFTRYRALLLSILLVVSALLLYSSNLRHLDRTTLFEKAVLQVTGPALNMIDASCRAVADIWTHYFRLVGVQEENDRLREETRQLGARLAAMEEVSLANDRLRHLLNFTLSHELPALPAQVVAEDVSGWFRTVVIDKGSSDGITEGMPVVVAEGVVGRVIRCADEQSRVLLITDPSSAVASLVQRNRTRGVSRGNGDTLSLDFALRRTDLETGDVIVTSGTGGVFPKGLVVGTVSDVKRDEYSLFQEVVLIPSVDFSRLEEVLVLLRERS